MKNFLIIFRRAKNLLNGSKLYKTQVLDIALYLHVYYGVPICVRIICGKCASILWGLV